MKNLPTYFKSIAIVMLLAGIFAVNGGIAKAQYGTNFVGGDFYDTYSYNYGDSYAGGDYFDTYSYDYGNSYAGGDFYDTYSYNYGDSYAGGDYFDTYSYNYGSNYVGGDYYNTYDYNYQNNFVGGDHYDLYDYNYGSNYVGGDYYNTYAHNYQNNFVGGDYYDTYGGNTGIDYDDNYVGGDYYNTYDYSHNYGDSYVGGDYYDTYGGNTGIDYDDNYVGGDYYNTYDYSHVYGDNYVGGDYYDTYDYSTPPIVYDTPMYPIYPGTPSVYVPFETVPYPTFNNPPYIYNDNGYYNPPSYNPPSYNPPSYNPPSYNPPSYNPPTQQNRPRCVFTVNDHSVTKGDYVTIKWSTTYATDVDINHSVGDVRSDGEKRIRITDDTRFTLTARGHGYTETCHLSIDVDTKVVRDNDVKCEAFTVSDSRAEKDDYVTLKWRTSGSRDVRINQGIGDVKEDGEKRVRIKDDTTFTLTVSDGNDEDTCKVEVRVDEDEKDDSLRCVLTISHTTIYPGQEVRLDWNNKHVDRAVLKDNHGNEMFDTRDRDDSKFDEDRGSLLVRPTKPTAYTLTVYDGNKKRTCEVAVDMETVVTGTRFQGGIQLGQVPYTGFEAGPILTFIFYGAIALWGTVMAYVLVFKKSVVAAVAAAPLIHGHITPDAHAVHSDTVSHAFDSETLPSYAMPTEEAAHIAIDIHKTLEAHAHGKYALLSGDALNFIASLGTTDEEKIAKLDYVIARAKAQFPKEGDWIVINKERAMQVVV